MAVAGALKVDCGEVFPHGLGVVGEVMSMDDFNASTKDNRVQARDKETGSAGVAGRGAGLRPAGPGEDAPGQDRGCGAAGAAGCDGGCAGPAGGAGRADGHALHQGRERPKIAYSLRCTGLAAPGRRCRRRKAA